MKPKKKKLKCAIRVLRFREISNGDYGFSVSIGGWIINNWRYVFKSGKGWIIKPPSWRSPTTGKRMVIVTGFGRQWKQLYYLVEEERFNYNS